MAYRGGVWPIPDNSMGAEARFTDMNLGNTMAMHPQALRSAYGGTAQPQQQYNYATPTMSHYGRQSAAMHIQSAGGAYGVHPRADAPYGRGGGHVHQHNTQHRQYQHATPETRYNYPQPAQQAYQYGGPRPSHSYPAMPPNTPVPLTRAAPNAWGMGAMHAPSPHASPMVPMTPLTSHGQPVCPADAYTPGGTAAVGGYTNDFQPHGYSPHGYGAPVQTLPMATQAVGGGEAGGDPHGYGVAPTPPWPNPEAAAFEPAPTPADAVAAADERLQEILAAAAAAGEQLMALQGRMAAFESAMAGRPAPGAVASREWRMPGTKELESLRSGLKPA